MATPGTAQAPYLGYATNLALADLDNWAPLYTVKPSGDDDTAAIQAAMTAAEAAGGGRVYCPAGTYRFLTPLGTYKIFLRPRNNVWLYGDGPGTIFQAANGLNTATSDLGFNFVRHVILDENRATIVNFRVSDITFDHNGLNNLIPSGFVGKDNVAVGVQVGSNLRVENCTFLNNAGRQTLSFGNNVSPQSISALFIRGNYFHNMGGSVTGNTYSTDHSSIYAQTIGGEISGNILTNDNAPFNNTALEIHCQNTTISNNNAQNYNTLFNLAATIADFRDNEITENTGTGLNCAFNLYQTGSNKFDRSRIEANVFEQVSTAATNFVLMSNVAVGIQSLVIRNNTFHSAIAAGGVGVVACLEIGLASRFDFSGNRVSGFPGRAVQLGTITAGVSLTIEDNTIIDCGTTSTSGNRGGVVLNSLNTIGYLSLQRNKVMNVAATYMTTAFGGNATITQGIAENNSVLGVASPYSGTILGLLSVFNVRQFGAKGDGVTDDTAVIQAALTAAGAVAGTFSFGASVYVPPGTYLVSTQLTASAGVALYGAGMRASRITSSYAGYVLKIGSTTSTAAYGCGVEGLSFNMTNATGGAIQAIGAYGFFARNLYLEGLVGSTNQGIFLDGGNAGNQFSTLDNITCNHIKNCLRLGSSGSVVQTCATVIGFNALTDKVAGDYGIKVDAGNGGGSRFFGGNLESCTTGIEIAGFGCQFFGMRFENNTTAVLLDSGAQDNFFCGCFNWAVNTVTDNSGLTSNAFLGCRDSNHISYPGDTLALATTLGNLTISPADNLFFAPNGTTARDILVNADGTYTGKLFAQAGDGSAAHGGGITLYGHSHGAHPGDVVAGISSGSGGAFRVNSQGTDAGTDYFKADASGLTVRTTQLMATTTALTNGAAAQAGTLTNAPAAGNPTKWIPINDNGTVRYLPAW